MKNFSKIFLIYIFLFSVSKNAHAKNNYDIQTEAMLAVKKFKKAIDYTDRQSLIQALATLDSLDLSKLNYPLSLLTEFCIAFKNGREDFYQIDVKYMAITIMSKLAEQTLVKVVKQKKYVNEKTKKLSIKQIELIMNLLNPYDEPCAILLHYLKYIKNVIEMLPENTNSSYEYLMFLYNACQGILNKDVDALKEALMQIYQKGKSIYNESMVELVSTIKILKNQVINNGDNKAFNRLCDIYQNTKVVGAKVEAIYALVQISTEYYSSKDNTENISITADQAYKAYTIILNCLKEKKFIKYDGWWKSKATATTGLVVLEGLLKNVDKNASNIISRILEELRNNERKKRSSSVYKISKKINMKPKTTKIETILNNRAKVYLLHNSLKTLNSYYNTTKNDPKLTTIDKKLDKLLYILENKK